jgi:hypothetical protein
MGMSSSQARLLTLTARMHDIEWRTQKIEADKLRLANDSRHAYEDYLRVLDAKKIQYKTLTQDGVITFRDATCNILQNGIIPGYAGERASDTLFLQSIEGKVMVTETVANKFGLKAEAVDKTMDEYLEWLGFTRTKEVMKDVEKEDPNSVKTYTVYPNTNETDPVNNVSHTAYQPQKNEEGGIDYDALSGYAKFNDGHSASTSGATPVGTGASLSASGKYTISSAEELKALMDNGNASNTAGSTFILTGNIDL